MSLHPDTKLPGMFRRIRLELAREPAHPAGDRGIGYTMVAPLKADGRLDVDTARMFSSDCKVIRFRTGEDSQPGYLRCRPGGFWAFHYELPDGEEDDDRGYRFADHRFLPGDYLTVIEDEGAHTYRVVTVEKL